MDFPIGASVTIPGRGDGIVIDTVPGPYHLHYRVLLRDRDPETGLLTSVETAYAYPGPDLPTFELGQRVAYFGRSGTIAALASGPDGDTALLIMDPDPVEPGQPFRQLKFTLPVWKLHVKDF